MYVDVTKPERADFLSQTEGCLIPGYTGHCPTLKFRFGKRYGANTKEILQELSDRGILKRHIAVQYRVQDPLKPILPNGKLAPISRTKDQTKENKVDSSNRCRRYILGYTGYIPGMHFHYGTSFRRAADKSVEEFDVKLAAERSRKALETSLRARSRSAPKIPTVRSLDHVKAAIKQYEQRNKYKEHHISPEFPPIAGYTGHIPRLRGTEASLSQRFHTAAKRGLSLLQQEREVKKNMDAAQSAVQIALMNSQPRHTTPIR
ncbi:ciliary microtubule inner protein 2B-like [Lycorma delicatula]|uniref:ciliary microtubule inner protein 2B-like n=1 Tax=Lycorma delicatula TaxID=130591 RepID=UPI003F516B40